MPMGAWQGSERNCPQVGRRLGRVRCGGTPDRKRHAFFFFLRQSGPMNDDYKTCGFELCTERTEGCTRGNQLRARTAFAACSPPLLTGAPKNQNTAKHSQTLATLQTSGDTRTTTSETQATENQPQQTTARHDAQPDSENSEALQESGRHAVTDNNLQQWRHAEHNLRFFLSFLHPWFWVCVSPQSARRASSSRDNDGDELERTIPTPTSSERPREAQRTTSSAETHRLSGVEIPQWIMLLRSNARPTNCCCSRLDRNIQFFLRLLRWQD